MKIFKKVAAMGAAIMMMASVSAMNVGAADNTYDFYISNYGSVTNKTIVAGYTSKAKSANVTYEISGLSNSTAVSHTTSVNGYYPTNSSGKFTSKGKYVKSHIHKDIKVGDKILVNMKLNPSPSGIGSSSHGKVYGS